jgi:hypothetical protein
MALHATTIRFADRAYVAIARAADAQGISVSQYVREAALIRAVLDELDSTRGGPAHRPRPARHRPRSPSPGRGRPARAAAGKRRPQTLRLYGAPAGRLVRIVHYAVAAPTVRGR